MKELDLSTWARKEHFAYYSGLSDPFICAAFNVDVTKARAYAKEHKISFYFTMVWLCTQAINSIDEFLLTIEGDKVYLNEERVALCTDLAEGSEVFHLVKLTNSDDLHQYVEAAKWESENNPKSPLALADDPTPMICFSCLPWVELTCCTNEHDFDCENAADDTMPMFTWGKYVEQDGKVTLNISLEVNHRVIDGYYIGQFVQKLEALIDALA